MSVFATTLGLVAIGAGASGLAAQEEDADAKIASAMSAAPAVISADATIMDHDGTVLREGDNGWTCFPETAALGAMCNEAHWNEMIGALMAQEDFTASEFSVSYMLAGDGAAPGVSNIDPYATEPTEDNDWVREGPHLMIIVPDPAMLEGMSTDPADPVYVMWKDTPYAHIMVRVEAYE
ncbi:hypothetical protein DDZ18_13520 [Marinicauda salina]|uniref:Uncharacterized protein n=1 Tax=Marinicauda salina TaxID=2135793 RepID=A0A2U2BQZ7_9PROT|nr:hypothetical protein [Marinicauda salina]PWE16432.1 hypothetical protein DDZ18_13520 [Marinicauda salina]